MHFRHRLGRLAAGGIAAILAVIASGCGDDDGDTLTGEEFREQANEICAAGNERLDEIFEELGDEPSEEELQEALTRAADDIQQQVEDIRALGAPDELADDVDTALEQAEEDLADFRAAAEEEPFTETNAMLTELGLDECAEE